MRCSLALTVALFGAAVSAATTGANELLPTSPTVGCKLQSGATIGLKEAAPRGGLQVTVTINDPKKALLAASHEQPGAPSITVKVMEGARRSPYFWVHGLADKGTVTYTASASGMPPATGTVTLAPSGVVIIGPFEGPKFATTTRATPSKLTVKTALLEPTLKPLEEQTVAGGTSVTVKVTSSNPMAGALSDPALTIKGGSSQASVYFHPAGQGETVLAAAPPPGFSMPASAATISATVRAPGLGVTTQVNIGHNLQVAGVLSLGELAPEGGLKVTLTSSDPSKLLISTDPKKVGAKSVELPVPAGKFSGSYYLQALGYSGSVNYTASASGFVSRTGTVNLTPSGVLLTPAAYGPPDEGEYLQPHVPEMEKKFAASLSKEPSIPLVVWTAQLHPVTKRGADITVQPLRAGLTVKVSIGNSDPAIGKVASEVTIEGGNEHVTTPFTAIKTGSTEISAATPPGFTTPSNGIKVTAVVRE